MKRIISLILVILIITLTFSGCFKITYSMGDEVVFIHKDVFIKVESTSRFFEKENVVLDFYYSLFPLDEKTIEEIKDEHCFIPSEENDDYPHMEATYAIYLSNSKSLVFEVNNQGYIIDHENKVNAYLYKYITFEEAFTTNYGYTSTEKNSGFFEINYNHCEKLVIPAELFNSENNTVYIHIVCLEHFVEEGILAKREEEALNIKYSLKRNGMVKLIFD